MADREDVLSTFSLVLTMGVYAGYVRGPGTGRYLGVVLSFALGLLAKPMLVTLPFVLFLLDYWPLGRLALGDSSAAVEASTSRERIARLVLEKLPLFVLAVGSSIATYVAQASKAATTSLESFPLGERVANALVSYPLYLVKTVWPTSLTVFYPHPSSVGARVPMWQALGAVAALAVVTWLALWHGRFRPYLPVGWLWYVGTLVPVTGIVQVGAQAMADRYTYVPLIGIFIAVAWGAPDLLSHWRYGRRIVPALGAAVIVGFSLATWIQTAHWRNNASLYTHAIAVTRKNWLAWNNLGNHYLEQGDVRQALASFQESLRIKQDHAFTWYNAGVALDRLGDHRRAIAFYQEALRLAPTYADAWVNRGFAHQTIGQHGQAIACYEAALRLRPEDGIAHRNLVIAHALQGNRGGALDAYRRLRAVDPVRADELLRSGGVER